MTIQQLREEKDRLLAEAKPLSERELTPEEETTFNDLVAKMDEIDGKLKTASRKDMLSNRSKNNAPSVIVKSGQTPKRDDAFIAWALSGRGLSNRHIEACDHFQVDPNEDKFSLRAGASMSVGTAADGGYLVPDGFVTQYEKKLQFISPVIGSMGSLPTPTANAINYPRFDDTTRTAEYKAEEGSITDNGSVPVVDEVAFPKAFDYYSKIIPISTQLLRDGQIDVVSLLFSDFFPERHAVMMESLIFHASNTGSTTPEPVTHGVSAGVNLDSGNVITVSKLFALETSLAVQYRNGASLVMHDATWQNIRQLQDDVLRPLINIDLQNGVEKRLLGYPVILCNSLTSIGSPGDNKPLILMANLDRYKIRRVGSVEVTRFNEVYRKTGQIGFMTQQCWDARWVGFASVCAKTLNSYDS